MDPSAIEKLASEGARLGTLAAVELQWGWKQRLDVCVVVVAPGPVDSRYTSTRLASTPGHTPDERGAAAVIVRDVAARLGVEASLLALEREHEHVGGSRWIDRQGPPPSMTFRCIWQAYWWDDEGRYQKAEGVEEADATSGDTACYLVRERVHARLGGWRRTIGVCTAMEGSRPGSVCEYGAMRPPTVPPISDVRAWRRAGFGAAALARRLLEGEPRPTTLDVMITFTLAFSLPVKNFAAIADWAVGRVSDDELNAVLDPMVLARELRWDRQRRLRLAWIENRLAAQVRLEKEESRKHGNSIELFEDLGGAFALGFSEGKILSHLSGANQDEDVNAFVLFAREGKSKSIMELGAFVMRCERAAHQAAAVT